RMRSLSVDLPWSTWAMTDKLRMRSSGVGMVGCPLSSSIARFGINHPNQRLAGRESADVLGDAGGEQRAGHIGRIARMGCDDAVRRGPQRVVIWQRFGVGDVEPGASDRPVLQRRNEVVGDD